MDRVLAETQADPDAERSVPKAVDADCALINFHVSKRDRLPPDLQRHLVEQSILTLDSMPSEALELVLKQGSPRRRALLTRLRRNPMSLGAVA